MINENWYTEVHADQGSAFSLELHDKLHEETTPFQSIAIYETRSFGTLMTIDGLVMLTDRDNFIYHEMMTHPALFTHAGARDVCVVGGGDCGTLREVLKHPGVEHAVQVEIDERVTRLSEQYFPELCSANADPRAELLFEDGIKWMAERRADSLDLIIIDSTDPVGPAEGLFQAPFYADCHRALRSGGILVQQSESPLYHLRLLKELRGAMASAGFGTVQTLGFPQCSYPSGWWSATLAGKNRPLDNFREAGARNRGFATHYYNPEVHRAAMALPEFVVQGLA